MFKKITFTISAVLASAMLVISVVNPIGIWADFESNTLSKKPLNFETNLADISVMTSDILIQKNGKSEFNSNLAKIWTQSYWPYGDWPAYVYWWHQTY